MSTTSPIRRGLIAKIHVAKKQAVGCAMRTVEPFGAHGAPYGIMNNSCRINSAVSANEFAPTGEVAA